MPVAGKRLSKVFSGSIVFGPATIERVEPMGVQQLFSEKLKATTGRSFQERMMEGNPRRSQNIADRRVESTLQQRRNQLAEARRREKEADLLGRVVENQEIRGHPITERGAQPFTRKMETELARAAAARFKAAELKREADELIRMKLERFKRSPDFRRSLLEPTR